VGASIVGKGDGDWGELEWFGHVCIEEALEENGQLGRMLLDQRHNINDSCSRGIGREFNRIAIPFIVDVKTKGRNNVSDDSEISRIEDKVESVGTRSLKPSLGIFESGGSGGVDSN
jgi:hypothetical protein